MWKRLLLTAVFMAAALQSLQAQDVSIQATVDRSVIGTQGTVRYTIEVEGASLSEVTTPEPPSTEGFALVQPTPNTRRNVSFYNGQMEQSVSFEWRFRPLRDGMARIHPATVRVDGQAYQTGTIEIEVVPQQQARGQQSGGSGQSYGSRQDDRDADGEILSDEELFIEAVPSSQTAYRNEQVTVTYRLYFREGIQIRQSRLAGSWDAEGFWREDLEVDPRPVPRRQERGEHRYRTIILKRVAVFPTRAGSLEVDPLSIETEAYATRGSQSNLFQRFFSMGDRYESIERSSPPVPIDVQPLPNGAPDAFSGAVGSLQLNVRTSPNDVEVGESFEVEVRLSGTGNIATLTAPALDMPDVFDVYDPDVELDIDRHGSRIRGTKTFTYTLVPRSNGSFELPSVRFSYFDPESESYRTLAEPLGQVNVTGQAEPPPTAASTQAGLPTDDIAGPMMQASWQPIQKTPLYRSPWPYLALAGPLALLLGLFTYQRHVHRLQTDRAYARWRRAHPAAREHLKEAERLMRSDNRKAFFAEVQRAILSFVGNRLNIPEHGLTRRELLDHLRAAGIPGRPRSEMNRLLARLDRARFSPAATDRTTMEAALNRARGLIQDLDKAFNNRPNASS